MDNNKIAKKLVKLAKAIVGSESKLSDLFNTMKERLEEIKNNTRYPNEVREMAPKLIEDIEHAGPSFDVPDWAVPNLKNVWFHVNFAETLQQIRRAVQHSLATTKDWRTSEGLYDYEEELKDINRRLPSAIKLAEEFDAIEY